MLPLILALAGPGGPGDHAPDRSWDLQHLHLALDLDPAAGRVEGSVTLTLTPLGPPSAEITLDQVGLDVSAVTVDGAPAPHRLAGEHLVVTLGEAAGPVSLQIAYAASPDSGLHFRRPGRDSSDTYLELWSQGEGEDNRHWLPLPDHPGDRFTTTGAFTAPDGYTVISNGVGGFDQGVWRYAMDEDLVSYLVMVAVGPYQRVATEWRGRPVEQWLPPDAEPAHAAEMLRLLPEMMQHFSDRTGLDYPYPIYREVYVQRFLYTGMENTTATVLHRRLLGYASSDAPDMRLPGEGYERVVAHELAHHWFGDALTCRDWSELWLNEGFARFMAHDWIARSRGEATAAALWLRTLDAAAQAGPLAGRFWSTPEGTHGPNSGVYVKGASLLRMLQARYGEEVFWAAIQRYVAAHTHGLVDTDDLRRAFEEVTGDHLRWFFDQWAHLPGAPALKVSPSWSGGRLSVRVTQTPPAGLAPFVLDLPLEIGTEAGPVRHVLRVDGAEALLQIPLEAAPRYVAVDPDGALLATITNTQSPEMWRAQLSAPQPYAQLRALRHGADADDPAPWLEATLPLLRAPAQAIALEAMSTAGALDGELGNTVLIEIMEDPSAEIERRIRAAEALGQGEGSDAVREALIEAVKRRRRAPSLHDRSLAAAALTSLGRLHREASHAEARAVLSARGPADPVQDPLVTAALDLLAKQRRDGDFALALRFVDPSLPTDVLHAAVEAAQRVALSMPDDDARRDRSAQLARRVEPLLHDAFQRTRAKAIGALGKIGDDQTRRALEAYLRREKVDALRAQAQQALSLITKRGGAPPPPEATVDGRLDDLERRLDALTRDLEALQDRL